MEKLLDFSLPDAEFVALLEQVIQVVYVSTNNEERNMAQAILTQLQELPDAWIRCDKVLGSTNSSSAAKFYALQILEAMIKYRWKTLPRETCESVRNYVASKIIELSSDDRTMQQEQVYIGKLNLILVHIVKQEWPQHWKSFMSDIIGASKTSMSRCENNLQILSLLSEEVFQFSAGQMTQEKTINLKNQFNDEFAQVFQLCQFVFDQSDSLRETRPSLIMSTLQTLEKFLLWIPVGYIFDTQLIEKLLSYLTTPSLRLHALKCLVEIGSLPMDRKYDHRFKFLYMSFLKQLMEIVPLDTDIMQAYEDADDETQAFVMDLALFFAGFFKSHLVLLESEDGEVREGLEIGLKYILKISTVNNIEVFKTCVDWWHMFTDELNGNISGPRQIALALAGISIVNPIISQRRQFYGPVVSDLRTIMISRMAKPEEVLIVEDENGQIVRETTKDTDAIALYRQMKETLVFLTHLDTDDTGRIMLKKLTSQTDDSHIKWNDLNTLCWAIGSISGAMGEAEEKKFLVTVIKELLQLCEITRGKDNKAVVASNIMYVVGQYPRFLRAHWRFLKTVVNKLFEFMHETHPGVQDMACDTFLKIAQKCKRKFVVTQAGETKPFICEMLDKLKEIIAELKPHQVHSFYESYGCIIAAQTNPETCNQLIMQLFKLPNESWRNLIGMATMREEILFDREIMKEFVNILKINTRVATSLGPPYYVQLQWIFQDMLKVYVVYSGLLSQMVKTGGPHATRSADARNMRAVKKEVLRVLEAFISNKDAGNKKEVFQTIIDPMMKNILEDYYTSVPDARDAEVLSLFAQIITFMMGLPVEAIRLIFKSLFECTLDMIKNNFEDYPDARLNFFKLLRAINQSNFSELFKLNDDPAVAEAQFKLVINAIIWAFKHTERNVAETGLVLLQELLVNVEEWGYVDYFYKTCFRLILNDILSVLTDTLHRPGFKYQARILIHLLSVVVMGDVRDPLWDPNNPEEVAAAGSPPSNKAFVMWHLENILRTAFPNLAPVQVTTAVRKLFSCIDDENNSGPNGEKAFKGHLRDFLVQTKEFSSGDNADLYDEEKQNELAEQRRREQERLAATPGLIAPITTDDGMAES